MAQVAHVAQVVRVRAAVGSVALAEVLWVRAAVGSVALAEVLRVRALVEAVPLATVAPAQGLEIRDLIDLLQVSWTGLRY